MNKSDFWFDLPPELIAQTPLPNRDASRLLCLSSESGAVTHRRFYELPALLRAGDCLVLNDSRVLPARLIGTRETGGAVEVVLLRDMGDCVWECLTRPGRKTKLGTRLIFGNGELTGEVKGEADGGNRLIRFRCTETGQGNGDIMGSDYGGVFLEVLERLGKMPLPPYIREELSDGERYQTVYAREAGSAAAPTAGLHFTNELLGEIVSRGVRVCNITLHVGLGTFRPVKTDVVEEHKMHAEYYTIPGKTAEAVNITRENGGRVIAVGTTSCRTLESCADARGRITEASGFTDIFIYPGYEFKCVDGLITNFHLPESTLIMLVSAFAGREHVLEAYHEAIRERYRFFSFGDAMLIIDQKN